MPYAYKSSAFPFHQHQHQHNIIDQHNRPKSYSQTLQLIIVSSMSSREDEVRERQRQMATRMRAVSASSSSSKDNIQDGNSSNKPKTRPKPPPPPGGPPSRKPPSMRNSAKGGGGSSCSGSGSRSLASLTTGIPSKPKPPDASAAVGTGRGAGTTKDPIVLDGAGSSIQKQKRPTQKRPGMNTSNGDSNAGQKPVAIMPPASTAEIALAQARQRMGIKQLVPPAKAHSSKEGAAESTSKSTKSSQLKRPTMRRNTPAASSSQPNNKPTSSLSSSAIGKKPTGGGGGSLSSILLSNTDTAKYLQPNAPKLLKHYRKIEPNDYWKNMREWDFLTDLNDKMGGSGTNNNNGGKRKRGNKSSSAGDDKDATNKGNKQQQQQHAPLPNTFNSYREYCALWAPLQLSEARAQILSESITNIPYWKSKPEKSPVRVRLVPQKKDLNGSSENMGVQIKEILVEPGKTTDNKYKDNGLMSNDIVLLVKNERCVWDASKGTLQQQQKKKERYGLIGNVEYTRRSIEGLTLQVSRELWSEVGSSEMVLLKLGCNITALREFTALSRMDSIPLLEYILGSKMSSKKKAAIGSEDRKIMSADDIIEDVDVAKEGKRAKREILSKLGGSSALGRGFAEYASHKFNVSQLDAISASAQEYGDGGFTLIKGPPGTGKVRIHRVIYTYFGMLYSCILIICFLFH